MTEPRISLIILSLLFAMVLSIIPLPEWGEPFRPEWVALLVFYWSVTAPRQFNIGSGWVIGLLTDILTGTLIGTHPLGMIIVSYAATRLHKSFRLFSIIQQLFFVALVMASYRVTVLWVSGMTEKIQNIFSYWEWTALMADVLIWPWIFLLFTSLTQRFGRHHYHND